MDYLTLPRAEWEARLGKKPSIESASLLPYIDPAEIAAIYAPLAELLHLMYQVKRETAANVRRFFQAPERPDLFIIGITGSVASGKSTMARILTSLLSGYPDQPKTAVLSTDQFLYPNRILSERGLMDKKGFPESYDFEALHAAIAALADGASSIRVPEYSHDIYDILPEPTTLERPDILVVEGLHVLGAVTGRVPLSDRMDVTLYVDAEEADLFRWYWERIKGLVQAAENRPESFYYNFKDTDENTLYAMARQVWEDINGKNLNEHILPTRERASLILRKDGEHRIREIKINKCLL